MYWTTSLNRHEFCVCSSWKFWKLKHVLNVSAAEWILEWAAGRGGIFPTNHSFVFNFYSYWSMVDEQCCVHFRCVAKWFRYTYTWIYFFFQILFPHRLLKNIEQTSLCYETVLRLQTALWSLDTHHSYVPESSQDFSVNHSTGASEWRAKLVSWSAQHCPRPRRKKIKLKKPVS